jgi:UDP-N-acetylglucosamine 2-epimerase (non-hydrolysing)
VTVRENTERPITLTSGTNQLVGRDLKKLRFVVEKIVGTESQPKAAGIPDAMKIPLWDGHAAERIAKVLVETFSPR